MFKMIMEISNNGIIVESVLIYKIAYVVFGEEFMQLDEYAQYW